MLDDFKNAFSRSNNGHVQLIIINVVVFLAMAFLLVIFKIAQADAIFDFLHKQVTIPPRIGEFIQRPWTIITYAFMHDISTMWHILWNMLALYWFGKLFVEYLGSDKLIAVYVLGALAAAGLYLLLFNTVPFFKDISNFPGMVGASGAVFAVMVAIATLIPDYTFFLLLLGPVRIKYIALFFLVGSFIGSIGPNAGGQVAHLGGALMGFLYTKQLQAGVNWGGWVTATLQWFNSLFKPSQKVKVTYRKTATKSGGKSEGSSIPQAEVDAILDKISAGGYESLSQEEKDKLFKASKK